MGKNKMNSNINVFIYNNSSDVCSTSLNYNKNNLETLFILSIINMSYSSFNKPISPPLFQPISPPLFPPFAPYDIDFCNNLPNLIDVRQHSPPEWCNTDLNRQINKTYCESH